MAEFDPATRFVRNDKLPSGEVDGELVALDLAKGNCFGLDRIGTEIWKMAATPLALSDMVARLTEQYEVSADQCAEDLRPFLVDMVDAGLLRVEQ